jgi:hypothetical protein
MNKLKLHLEDLQIDSFQTTPAEKPKGTVFGEQCTCYTQCTCPGCPTCAGYGTCDASCNGTCDASCNGTCNASCDGGCTWDPSCGGYSCEYTCDGWRTYGPAGQFCMLCVG